MILISDRTGAVLAGEKKKCLTRGQKISNPLKVQHVFFYFSYLAEDNIPKTGKNAAFSTHRQHRSVFVCYVLLSQLLTSHDEEEIQFLVPVVCADVRVVTAECSYQHVCGICATFQQATRYHRGWLVAPMLVLPYRAAPFTEFLWSLTICHGLATISGTLTHI